ncbi:rhomboid-domain-containing protein [Karstenula rhodostoma CBS 690.94]|uniref:Rhomboid-domain-containing protein n=1 Tax=Karstenula rhodostoma CBS 690.94 TaxID=1392251 RepID=A0A9P4UC49_9PLEO|nr:rhomboid-domain-containing protein [Karstenula rhodostoma CBS 690.94]
MSLFQHLARTLRPTPFSAMSTFRVARSARSPKLDSNFFGSGTRLGLPRRTYYTNHTSNFSSNMRLIYSFIGLNAGVFAYATYLQEQARQGHQLPFTKFIQNMSLSPIGVIREHRYWTTITSVFSHLGLMHVAGNMLSFYFMGQMLAVTPGFTPGKIAVLVLGSGLAGSVGWLFTAMKNQNYQGRALGFSGSVMGVGTVAAFLYPRTQFMIYGIIPMPLWLLMAGYAVFDGYYLNDRSSRVGHAGHLGGLAFGIVYYFARVRGLRI